MASRPVEVSYVTTRGVTPGKRGDVLREACEANNYIIEFDVPKLGDSPLEIESAIRRMDGIELWHSRGCANKRRSQATIDRNPLETYMITEQVAGTAYYGVRGGRSSFELGPGEMLVSDLDVPFDNDCGHGFAHRMWFIPKALLPDVRIGGGATLLEPGVTTHILRSYLDQVRHAVAVVPADAALQYARAVAPLLAAAIAPQADFEGRRDGLLGARRLNVYRLIGDRLTEPELSPAQVAQACGISVRTLHNLFASAGESFSDYVAARRLDRCRTLLLDPDAAFRSVADIAYSCGFTTLSTFYARYGERYGETPGDTRLLDAARPAP